jgi:hypothetical protein
LLKEQYSVARPTGKAVAGIDVLFGSDAVDPRLQWSLASYPLRLDKQPLNVSTAHLSVLRDLDRSRPADGPVLKARGNGTFRIVQLSDTHMGTGPGTCEDAIHSDGFLLPESEVDTLTVDLIGKILDAEEPDLVVLTGDQLHHDILDSKTAILKLYAPMIERKIPFAAVFGNHDSEGIHALCSK